MSVTFSAAKQVAAIVAPNGMIFYALFEKTYESNVYPQTQNWSACYFGTAQACMQKIIDWSAVCEGGCLQEPGKGTTPSTYLKHWREAMADPVELQNTAVSASFGNGLYTLKPENRDTVAALLVKHGHPGLDGDVVKIQIGEQPELLQAIIEAGNPAWKFLDHINITNVAAEWATYLPKPSKGVVPEFSAFFLQDKPGREPDYWVIADGQVTGLGWEYSTIGWLIKTYACASELAYPGSAESAIKAIRAEVKKARPFPLEQRIRIDRTKAEGRFWDGLFNTLAMKLGVEGLVINTTIREIKAADASYEFRSMTDSMVNFIDLPHVNSGEQQQLLAA